MITKEQDFLKSIDMIRQLFHKEILSVIEEENPNKIAAGLYKSALYSKLLDIHYIVSNPFDNIMKKLINAITPLKRDEAFLALVLFTKIVLDTLSIIQDVDENPMVVDLTEMFTKIVNILNTRFEIPNSSMVETNCIICGETMMVEQGKEDFANICKACKYGV